MPSTLNSPAPQINLEAALAYAARGWPVFPCKPDKTPATPHGFKDATKDPATIRRWWSENPSALIGAPTGPASGFVVIDLDYDPAKGIDGPSVFASLCKRKGKTIRTRKHRTPRGGAHLFFLAGGDTVRNSASKIGAGIDTRGDGGYVILPPSSNGAGAYTVERDMEPAPLPPWLEQELREHGVIPSPLPEPLPMPANSGTFPPGLPLGVAKAIQAGAPEGQRNDRALWIAAQLRDEGHDRATVEGYVLRFAANCRPALPEREARAVVDSALSRLPREPARNAGSPVPHQRKGQTTTQVHSLSVEAPEPWEAPSPLGGLSEPPPPWPWDALASALRGMGREIERTFNVSAEMAAAAVLGVASIALGNKARVQLKRDHLQFGNLFFMVSAAVAAGKTPVMRAAQSPLVEWQEERRAEWLRAVREWEAAKSVCDARVKTLEARAGKCGTGKDDADPEALQHEIARLKEETGERPPEPILFCADATSEALGRRMQERGGAIGVLSGEARKILAIAKGRYVEGGDIDLWLAGHAGDYLRVDRSAREKPSYEIREACLSACIMTQPDSLQSLGASEPLRESGFLARWLYLVPDHDRGDYPVDSIPEAVVRDYKTAIRALIDLPLARYANGDPAPHLVTLSPDAFARWREYHDATLAEIGKEGQTRPGAYLQWLGKLPEHVARLALLFHLVRAVERGEMPERIGGEIEEAFAVAEALKVHARRAFATMGADLQTARARKVWEWLARKRDHLREWREAEGLPGAEAVKAKDLHRYEVAGLANSADAEEVLFLLADKGYLQAVDLQTTGRKPQRLFYLTPQENADQAFSRMGAPDFSDSPDYGGAKSGKSGKSGSPERKPEEAGHRDGLPAWGKGPAPVDMEEGEL